MGRSQEDFEEEIRSHLAHESDRLVADGMAPADAAMHARRRFGNRTVAQETFYFSRRSELFDALRSDTRFAVRTLWRSKWLSAAMIAVLAIGLGTTAAIFGILDSVVLAPLPYARPAELVSVGVVSARHGGDATGLSAGEFSEWRKDARLLTGIAAFRRWGYELDGANEPERVLGARVSANLFSLLGVHALRGRVFAANEDEPSADPVVIISDSLWHAAFSARADVVGRSIELNGRAYTVVGVVDERTAYPSAALWIPYVFAPYELEQRGDRALSVVGRVPSSATIAQARDELAELLRAEGSTFPNAVRGWSVAATPLRDVLLGNSSQVLTILFIATCVLLLVACANVGNALLARLLSRRRELAIRSAIGASAWRLTQQLAVESLVLVGAGGAGALAFAGFAIRTLGRVGAAYLPRSATVRLDGATLVAALGLMLAVAAVITATMAFSIARLGLSTLMKSRGAPSGPSRFSLREFFVIGQLALAVVLGMDAWLLVSSLRRIEAVSVGFDPRATVAATIALPSSRYPSAATRAIYFANAAAAVRSLPFVRAAAYTSRLPFAASATTGVTTALARVGEGNGRDSERPHGGVMAVSPGYFDTMRIGVVAGRVFTSDDRADKSPVIVVDEAIARQLVPDGTAVGAVVRLIGGTGADSTPREVVGVVRAVRMTDVILPPDPLVYLPYEQAAWPAMSIVVRVMPGTPNAQNRIRETIRGVDPSRPVYNVHALAAAIADHLALRRLQTLLVTAFGAAALSLAFIGVYSVVSFSVKQREREFGIRLAIGASHRQVTAGVVGETMWQVVLAAGVGLAAAIVSGIALSAVVVGVSSWDPVAIVAMVGTLGVGALIAAYLPARRAAQSDPIRALRAE